MSELRLLRSSDIPSAMRLKTPPAGIKRRKTGAGFWNSSRRAVFGIEREGRLVAITTAICYGRELAWIGMVLTDPEFRGQGLAGRSNASRWTPPTWEGDCTRSSASWMNVRWSVGYGRRLRWRRSPWARANSMRPWICARLARTAPGCSGALQGCESVSIPGSGFAMGRPVLESSFISVRASPPLWRTLHSASLVGLQQTGGYA
jgi:hypothetical protein